MMSKPFESLVLGQNRASKITIEIKDIPQQKGNTKTISSLNTDADGSDLSYDADGSDLSD